MVFNSSLFVYKKKEFFIGENNFLLTKTIFAVTYQPYSVHLTLLCEELTYLTVLTVKMVRCIMVGLSLDSSLKTVDSWQGSHASWKVIESHGI